MICDRVRPSHWYAKLVSVTDECKPYSALIMITFNGVSNRLNNYSMYKCVSSNIKTNDFKAILLFTNDFIQCFNYQT